MATLPELPVSKDVERVRSFLLSLFESHQPVINKEQARVLAGGKLLRSSLLLLVNGLQNGQSDQRTIELSSSIELLHIASLLHDDIIDEADERRGAPTLHLSLGTSAAILLGDLNLVEAIKILVDHTKGPNDVEFMRSYIESAHRIVHGQIKEVHNREVKDLEGMKAKYFRVIEGKTAELIRFATGTGAYTANCSQEVIASMQQLGYHLGMAFQIIDDILDLIGTHGVYKKTMMKDLFEQRLSLPVVYALHELPNKSALHKVFNENIKAADTITMAHKELLSTHAIKLSLEDAKRHTDNALELLKAYPDSIYKTSITELANWMLERTI